MNRRQKVFFAALIACIATLTKTMAIEQNTYPQMMDISKQAAGNLSHFQFYYISTKKKEFTLVLKSKMSKQTV